MTVIGTGISISSSWKVICLHCLATAIMGLSPVVRQGSWCLPDPSLSKVEDYILFNSLHPHQPPISALLVVLHSTASASPGLWSPCAPLALPLCTLETLLPSYPLLTFAIFLLLLTRHIQTGPSQGPSFRGCMQLMYSFLARCNYHSFNTTLTSILLNKWSLNKDYMYIQCILKHILNIHVLWPPKQLCLLSSSNFRLLEKEAPFYICYFIQC